MRILIACECSGRVRDAFRRRGHDAISCDILETEAPGPHIIGDVRKILKQRWDALIGFPPCTYLCGSGIHWNGRHPDRPDDTLTEEAIEFFLMLWHAPIPRIALENPVGIMSTRLGKPHQYIQPYQFGEDASKKTGLWLKDFPRLRPTLYVPPRIVEFEGKLVKRWSNQTDSGQNILGPSEDRAHLRSATYPGIADAMGEQWGSAPREELFLS